MQQALLQSAYAHVEERMPPTSRKLARNQIYITLFKEQQHESIAWFGSGVGAFRVRSDAKNLRVWGKSGSLPVGRLLLLQDHRRQRLQNSIGRISMSC
ncbi:hypothetical protein J7E62_32735 [Variovorax paradoxus]|nr:hypothetical protein [Variovorax paradoxus]